MELELGTGDRATITDWAFPARKGKEYGEKWQEGHLSPGQQPCWGVGEVTGKEDGAVRELGVEERTSMTQGWETRASSKRRKAKRIQTDKTPWNSIPSNLEK